MIVFKAHDGDVYSVAFSPTDGSLATAGKLEVRIWPTPGEKPKVELPLTLLHSGCRIAFSPDGLRLGCAGTHLRLWDLRKPLHRWYHSEWTCQACCFSPDGKVFVAQGQENPLRLWDMEDEDESSELPGGWGGTREDNRGMQFPLGCVAYSPDGSTIASGFAVSGEEAFDSVVFLFDANSGAVQGKLHAPYASAHPSAIVFSPTGKFLAGTYGPNLRVWDVAQRAEVAHRQVGKKHFKDLAFTPDGTRLVTVSNDEIVRLWDTASWSEVEAFQWKIGKLGCVAVSPDGMRMAAGGNRGKVVVWDVD